MEEYRLPHAVKSLWFAHSTTGGLPPSTRPPPALTDIARRGAALVEVCHTRPYRPGGGGGGECGLTTKREILRRSSRKRGPVQTKGPSPKGETVWKAGAPDAGEARGDVGKERCPRLPGGRVGWQGAHSVLGDPTCRASKCWPTAERQTGGPKQPCATSLRRSTWL